MKIMIGLTFDVDAEHLKKEFGYDDDRIKTGLKDGVIFTVREHFANNEYAKLIEAGLCEVLFEPGKDVKII